MRQANYFILEIIEYNLSRRALIKCQDCESVLNSKTIKNMNEESSAILGLVKKIKNKDLIFYKGGYHCMVYQ